MVLSCIKDIDSVVVQFPTGIHENTAAAVVVAHMLLLLLLLHLMIVILLLLIVMLAMEYEKYQS